MITVKRKIKVFYARRAKQQKSIEAFQGPTKIVSVELPLALYNTIKATCGTVKATQQFLSHSLTDTFLKDQP
jgi:hypothetical protein